MMDGLPTSAELAAWYWLAKVKGVGPAAFRVLIENFGNPASVHSAGIDDLRAALAPHRSIRTNAAEAIEADKRQLHGFEGFAERQLHLADACGGLILTLADSRYPRGLLAARSFAPPVLHVLGRLDAFGPKRLAIVGTRGPSDVSVRWSKELARDAAAAGYTIVSGLALGIDAASHAAALDAGGSIVAVLGCGVDVAYPPENRKLYRRIVESGLIVSEFPFGVSPSGDLLRKRKKVIVASADAVVVAECPVTSGAMIAARAAIQQNKPLFAFAGGQGDPSRGSGTALLIEAGLAAPLEPGGGIPAAEQGIARFAPPVGGDRRFAALSVRPAPAGRGTEPSAPRLLPARRERSLHSQGYRTSSLRMT